MGSSRRLRRVFALLLSVSLLTIAAGTASAAPSKPTVKIDDQGVVGTTAQIDLVVNRAAKQIASCSYVVDSGDPVSCGTKQSVGKSTMYLVEITGQAVGAHNVTFTVVLTDGGRGTVSTSFTILPPRVFVTAWTDVNGNHTYEPLADSLIAKLVDTDRSNTVSAGDTIVTNAFPLDFAATSFADATVTDHVVTSVTAANSVSILVNAGQAVFIFQAATFLDRYGEAMPGVGVIQIIDEAESGCTNDSIFVRSTSPSQPTTGLVSIATTDCADAGFIDVTIS